MNTDLPPPTGIPELNCLLGMNKQEHIPLDHTTVLIRGGQGAGKTTLALQMLSNRLAAEDEENYGLFLSLERPAKDVLQYAHDRFRMFTSADDIKDQVPKRFKFFKSDSRFSSPGCVLGLDGREFTEKAKKAFEKRNEEMLESLKKAGIAIIPTETEIGFGFIKWRFGVKSDVKERVDEKRKEKETEYKGTYQHDLAEALCEYLSIPLGGETKTLFLVVDSLNMLERAIYQRTELERYRAALQGLGKALFDRLNENRKGNDKVKIVILFTGEYHAPDLDVSGASGESFFCDVEILLSQEPIVGKARTDPRNSAAAGYNIELHHNPRGVGEPGKDSRDVVETRAFCRVLKSRFSKNQSRRCSYTITSGKGFQFDANYPGDGHLLLFQENPKQKEDWEELVLQDAPHEFPALRYELFDRTGLQRIFSTQRHFHTHPHDTDLRLVSLDTYWINWFIELEQRSTIKSCLEENGVSEADFQKEKDVDYYSRLICRIHQFFREMKPQKDGRLPEKITIRDSEEQRILSAAKLQPNLAKNWKGILSQCWDRFLRCTGALHPIRRKELRLFGEEQSPLLKKLASRKYITKNAGKDDETLLSIPFNANVSFLVYRKDLLNGIRDKTEMSVKKIRDDLIKLLKNEQKDVRDFVKTSWPGIQDIWRKEEKKGKDALRAVSEQKGDGEFVSPAPKAKICETLAESLVKGNAPTTWEEIIVLCRLAPWEMIVETQSFDTLLCTFLEFLWGCGAEIMVNAEYQMTMTKQNLARLYQAIFLLQQLLHEENGHRIIPQNSTVDAKVFGKKYSKPKDEDKSQTKRPEWAFMRQWHSTLVDILVAKDTESDESYWRPDSKIELEIMPIPKSFWQLYGNQTVGAAEPGNKGLSCWGDWHLAVLEGSENEKLAVAVLNNLMSSAKVTNRALRGAALPTVRDFYTIYKKTPCVLLPERSGDLTLPAKTFEDMQKEIFSCAKTRADIFDYRHCMLEFHGFIEQLLHNPSMEQNDVREKLVNVFKRIRNLRDRQLLLH